MVICLVPGGVPDLVARALSAKLSESLGQSFIGENKAAAGGSGDVPVTITSFAAAGPHILSGAVNLLAVTAPQRLGSHPDVPSLSEVIKDYDGYDAAFGVLAPIGTPPDVVAKLSRAMKQAAESPDFIDKFKGQATVVKWNSPDDYRELLRDNQKKFDRAVKLLNLLPNRAHQHQSA